MIVDFIVENRFLSHVYVLKIHVRAYFKKQLSVGISALVRFMAIIRNVFARYGNLNYRYIGVESFTDG